MKKSSRIPLGDIIYPRNFYKKWRSDYPAKEKAQSQNRRASILDIEGILDVKELIELWEIQEGYCYYCRTDLFPLSFRKIHVDHKIPLSQRGLNTPENICWTCEKCNTTKNNKTEKEFIKLLFADLWS